MTDLFNLEAARKVKNKTDISSLIYLFHDQHLDDFKEVISVDTRKTFLSFLSVNTLLHKFANCQPKQ